MPANEHGAGVHELVRRLGWRVRYVPHSVTEDYNACYRVAYKGTVIAPPAAERLGIPLNEIWLSEKLRGYEDYVLFHEVREIMYRYQGFSVEEAHLRARVDEALEFCGDPRWLKYFEEFPDSTVPRECLQELCNVQQRGVREQETLYRLLLECANRRRLGVSQHHNGRNSMDRADKT